MPTDEDIQKLVDYTEILKQLEKFRELNPLNPGLVPSSPRPSCGYCPTCGRRTAPYYDPYITWTSDTITVGSNDGT